MEAAVAIAEVKWLEEEQKKISEAVEQAMQTARETWQEEEKRDIGIIMYKNIYVTLLNIRVNSFGTAQKRLRGSRMFAGSRFSALVKT